jgi:hypothetical protein
VQPERNEPFPGEPVWDDEPDIGRDDGEIANLLNGFASLVRRYVVLTDRPADAIALWIVHTHTFAAARELDVDYPDTTPYLGITSAEKKSGKTRLLEVLAQTVSRPLSTMNISDAALFRVIASRAPTLLFDEIDAVFGPKARDREDLRGLLNAGYRRGELVYRMGGASKTKLEEFDVFCPKAIAGIGKLPETLADRSIAIRLERKTRAERVERFRQRDVAPATAELRRLAEEVADRIIHDLVAAAPDLPDELDDRAQDMWEPLLAIADLAGGDWPERARTAALELSTGDAREDESLGVRLLADIRAILEAEGIDRVKTSDLLTALAADDDAPWGNWYGKPITSQALGHLLRPYGIKTREIWADNAKARGYRLEQFEDAWVRYLPDEAPKVVGAVEAAPQLEPQGGRKVRPEPVGDSAPTTLEKTPTTSENGEGGRRKPAPQAGPTTPTTLEREESSQSPIPQLGDAGYLSLLETASRNSHITEDERKQARLIHLATVRSGAA